MEKSELKILVVEDDQTLGKGLVDAFKKVGFSALLASKPDEALAVSRMQVFNAYVIDCLLPKTSGVELARQLREQIGAETPVILTSGIYKDKTFVKEALAKTGAIAFFEKPFILNSLIEKVESVLKDLIDDPIEPFLDILFKSSVTPGEKAKAVTSTKSLHGFELVRAISYLMGPSIRGTLSLKDLADGSSSSISFADSKIVKVNVKDPQSFFGALLVDKNFISAEELELALATPSNKKVGERLVDANLISPHVISIVQSEQMAIRLSLLIKDTSYEVSWKDEPTAIGDSSIDHLLIYSFFSDWVISKLNIQWLKTFYLPLMENKITKTLNFNESHAINYLPPFTTMRDLSSKVVSGTNLQQLVSERTADEEKIFGCIHLLVITGQICFDKTTKVVDITSQIARFKRIKQEIESKNFFEILGVSTKSKANDIKKAYHELAKVFHPDKLAPGTPEELKSLTREIFAKMTVSYEALSNESSKAKYLKELEQGRAEKILQSEALFEEAKVLIKASQATKALEKLRQAMSMRPPTSDLILHNIWARLMTLSAAQDQQKELLDIEASLGKIPPEERHSAIYYFVKGLFQKYLGDVDLATRNLQHALSMMPTFIEAKRELNVLRSSTKSKPVDIFKDDLSSVVSSLFKKKK